MLLLSGKTVFFLFLHKKNICEVGSLAAPLTVFDPQYVFYALV